MYCQYCGSALNPQTKYCNRCGTQLALVEQKSLDTTRSEKRLDQYLDGLFWISTLGLAFIIGGVVMLTKMGLRDFFVVGYAILSTIVFLINFGFSLWGAVTMMRRSKDGKLTMQPGRETHELDPSTAEPVMMPAGSVTDQTTRSFEPIYNKQKTE